MSNDEGKIDQVINALQKTGLISEYNPHNWSVDVCLRTLEADPVTEDGRHDLLTCFQDLIFPENKDKVLAFGDYNERGEYVIRIGGVSGRNYTPPSDSYESVHIPRYSKGISIPATLITDASLPSILERISQHGNKLCAASRKFEIGLEEALRIRQQEIITLPEGDITLVLHEAKEAENIATALNTALRVFPKTISVKKEEAEDAEQELYSITIPADLIRGEKSLAAKIAIGENAATLYEARMSGLTPLSRLRVVLEEIFGTDNMSVQTRGFFSRNHFAVGNLRNPGAAHALIDQIFDEIPGFTGKQGAKSMTSVSNGTLFFDHSLPEKLGESTFAQFLNALTKKHEAIQVSQETPQIAAAGRGR